MMEVICPKCCIPIHVTAVGSHIWVQTVDADSTSARRHAGCPAFSSDGEPTQKCEYKDEAVSRALDRRGIPTVGLPPLPSLFDT